MSEQAEHSASLGRRTGLQAILDMALGILRADNDRSRTQRDAVIAFLVRVFSAGILYLSQVALARWMGGHEYGIYVFVWTWVLVLGGLSELGFSMAVMRLIPEYKETGQTSLSRGVVFGSRMLVLGVSTTVMLIGMLVLYGLGDRVSSDYALPVFLALICVPMFAMTDLQDGIGRANAWMTVALVPPYILRPAAVLGAMFVFRLLEFPMIAQTAAAAAIIASWLAVSVQTIFLQRRLQQDPAMTTGAALGQTRTEAATGGQADGADAAIAAGDPGARKFAFKTWLRTAAPLMVIIGCEIVLQNTDVLIVSKYLTPTDVGIYFAAAKTMALIMFVHYAVGSAVANRFAALHTRGDQEAMREFVGDAVNWTFWPSLAAAAMILILGKPLLWLFGQEFMAGYPVMFILVLGFLLRSAMGPAEFLLNMMGQQRACAINLVCAAILNILLNFLLVPIYGLLGAATATASALVTVAILNYFVARRQLGLDIAIWQNMKLRSR